MRKIDPRASTAMLMHKFSMSEFLWSMVFMFGIISFAFFLLPDSVADMQTEGKSDVWNFVVHSLLSVFGERTSQLIVHAVGGLFAGIVTVVCFVVTRNMLLQGMRTLRLLDFCRIRFQLMYWMLLLVLSMVLSGTFVNDLACVTSISASVVMSCVAVGFTVLYLRVKRPILLVVVFTTTGALSALTLTGGIVLLISFVILYVPVLRCIWLPTAQWQPGFGGGVVGMAYGSGEIAYGTKYLPLDGGSNEDEKFELYNRFEERMRLSLFLFFFTGFLMMLTLVIGGGMIMGGNLKTVFLDWVGGFSHEFAALISMKDLPVVGCGMMIAMIFVLYRFKRMLNAEYYLTVLDMLRISTGAMIACGVLVGIGRGLILASTQGTCVTWFVTLSIQILACILILMAVVVFLVNVKCRRCRSKPDDSDDGKLVGKYNRMSIPLLLFIDVIPLVLLVAATVRLWQRFLG